MPVGETEVSKCGLQMEGVKWIRNTLEGLKRLLNGT